MRQETKTTQVIFVGRRFVAGRKYALLPAENIFIDYAGLGGGKTGDKEAG